MNTRPLIGYATRGSIATTEFTTLRFANNESYAYAIVDSGGAPVMIPSIPDEDALDRVYETLDGFLLTGGPDVSPELYGWPRHPKTDAGDLKLEHAEFYLARRALADGMPILGICRGLQTLNVIGGGTLYQDVSDERGGPIKHPRWADAQRATVAHTVRVEAETRLGRTVGLAEIGVNSLHHQGIRELAPGFVATAVAPDGLVEAIERPDLPFVVAVQWHPEELYANDPVQKRLFESFVAAAAAHRERRARS